MWGSRGTSREVICIIREDLECELEGSVGTDHLTLIGYSSNAGGTARTTSTSQLTQSTKTVSSRTPHY